MARDKPFRNVIPTSAAMNFTLDAATGGNMAVTSTHTDIPGCTRTIVCPSSTAVYRVVFAGWLIAGNTTHTVVIECLADGALQTGAAVLSGSTTGSTISFPWRVTGLTVGSRIIKLRAYTAGVGQTGIVSTGGNSVMTIERTD